MTAAALRLPSRVSGTTVTKFGRRKEADKVGSWKLGWFYCFLDKLKQVRTLRVLCTSTLSVVSAITLCVRSGCLSRHRPCARVSTPSLNELPFHGGFYPVSTPITAIRHRCSSFCTWPTYLPLSPESFSRCRLRWTTPPSPQSCLPPFAPVNMEFHIFLCALFLCKVLLLIKQQHEFEGILLLEGMRKRRAQEADLFGGCASLRSISFLPLPPPNRSVWMKVRSKDWSERVVLLEFSDLEWN